MKTIEIKEFIKMEYNKNTDTHMVYYEPVEEHTPKYEDGCYYKAIYSNSNEELVVMWCEGYFYMSGDVLKYSSNEFDSIGDKIEFHDIDKGLCG